MNKVKIGVIAVVAMFLFLSLGYSQQLSDKERQIYYDAAWTMLQSEYQMSVDSDADSETIEGPIQQILDQNNLTEDQLEDIIERGNNMPFTAAEEQLAREIETEITEDFSPDQTMAKLKDLANKYGMSMGQASSVFTRLAANPA